MKKKIKIIDLVIIAVLVIINILPGSPLRYNIDIPNTIINAVALIYLIISISKKYVYNNYIYWNRYDDTQYAR